MRMRDKAQLSNYWINRAKSLHWSTMSLYDIEKRNVLTDPLHLLAGLSIEVLLKAILVKQNQGFNEQKYKGHILTKLIKITGVSLDNNQIATIEFYEEAIIWMSKYPMPTSGFYEKANTKLRNLTKKLGKSNMMITTPNLKKWPSEENYLAIWNKIYTFYWEILSDNPDEFNHDFIVKEET